MYYELLQQRYGSALMKYAASPAIEAARVLDNVTTPEMQDTLQEVLADKPIWKMPKITPQLAATGGVIQGNDAGFTGGYNRGHGATLLGGGVGGLLGAGTGALLGEEDKVKSALLGGAVGSTLGAVAAPTLLRKALKTKFMNDVVAEKFPKLIAALEKL